VRKHPLAEGATAWTTLAVVYLALFSAYWLAALVRGWMGGLRRCLLLLFYQCPGLPDRPASAACHPPSSTNCCWPALCAPLALQAHLVYEVRELAEIKHFCNHKLGLRWGNVGVRADGGVRVPGAGGG
jgi:hypothetical protein